MCFNHVPATFYQIFIFSPNDSTSKRHSTIKAGTPEHGTAEHEQWQNSSGNTGGTTEYHGKVEHVM